MIDSALCTQKENKGFEKVQDDHEVLKRQLFIDNKTRINSTASDVHSPEETT